MTHTATLYGTIPGSVIFSYTLSKPTYHACRGIYHIAKEIHILTRPESTTIYCGFRQEILEVSGTESHAKTLHRLGYEWVLSPNTLSNCADEELVDIINEFEKTGDDTTEVWAEIGRR